MCGVGALGRVVHQVNYKLCLGVKVRVGVGVRFRFRVGVGVGVRFRVGVGVGHDQGSFVSSPPLWRTPPYG